MSAYCWISNYHLILY